MHPNVQKWLDFEYAPQKSQEWLDLRMGMLTASDAASAIGVNKYETPDQLLLRKCGKGPVFTGCLLYTSPSPRDKRQSRMPSSA